MFCVDELSDRQIWAMGDQFAAAPTGRVLIGRAELSDGNVTSVGELYLERDDQLPRHANIAGWPEGKDEWKSLAQELAAMARLSVRSEAA